MRDQARIARGVFAIVVGGLGVATGMEWIDMPSWTAGVELFIAGVFGMDGQRLWKWMFGG